MKTPSTFLYDLVHTLSKSEKRYVKVMSGTKDNDYIHLMDALLAQKTFDESQLVKNNKGANFLKHLPVNKRYLYELLLKSLAQFGQKAQKDKVLERIEASNVLIKKGLFAAALGELKKGYKIAEKHELFELQILLSNTQKKLLYQQQSKIKDNDLIHHIFNAEMKSLEQLKNTNEYWYLAQKVSQFQIRFQKIQNEEQQKQFEEIIASPLFHNVSLATNFKSQLYYYQSNATYQFMLGNVEQAYEINKNFLDLLEAHSHFLKIYAERYLATLNNMLIDSFVIGKYDKLTEGIERLAMTVERPEFKSIKDIESRVFRQRYLLLINWSLKEDIKKAIEWIPDIEKGLERFGKKIEKHHRITFYYLVAYLLFLNGRYDQALQWNNLIIYEPKEDVVKEIFHFARILNLLLHYELGNYTLLESLLLSTPKYIKARRSIYATEKALFRFLRKSLNSIDKKEQQQLTSNFNKEIHSLFQIPKEKRVFNYLDLRQWIEAKK